MMTDHPQDTDSSGSSVRLFGSPDPAVNPIGRPVYADLGGELLPLPLRLILFTADPRPDPAFTNRWPESSP